ncbi:hypothetical protein [Myxacorys almedinensis]|uniref:PEP-CTERM sorting domain-containing protein n=1 Tax=Myxacorys almedinensis A TaxID=2690445 RepID=A0A8J7YZD6_9CYAN|nr:hypothetical protein [Myxacorys almedinensis]NDJ17382.1 hypothetical protein [Myxacorys almedinensis A]
MHCRIAWLFSSLGVLLIVAPNPASAAIFRQNLELTVTRIESASQGQADSPLNKLPLPPIGSKGLGSYTYDESQLNYINQPTAYPIGYYLGRPGAIAFSDFSLNFFNRNYTQLTYVGTRIGEFLLYDRTPAGQYTPQSLYLSTTDDTSVVRIIGDLFIYRPGSVNVPGDIGAVNYVSGTFSFTDAEPIPEPPATAIVPIFGLGLGWLYQRTQARRRSANLRVRNEDR